MEIRALGPGDRERLLELLARNPVRDVFIVSRVLHDGALGPIGWSPLWGAFGERGGLRGVLHVGPNLIPAIDDLATLDALAPHAAGPGPTRMLVGERGLVERLWSVVGHTYPAPREVRRCQFVYVLDGRQLALDLAQRAPGRARLAEPADEDVVLELSAAMHVEEMGEDPLVRDPAGYRRRVQLLTERGWTYVYEWRGRIVFKMDVGCASDRTAQVQGVYVPPDLRGRGAGRPAWPPVARSR